MTWMSKNLPCETMHPPILTGKPVKGSQVNSVDPDQMLHNAVSDQSLQCLQTGFSIKKQNKSYKIDNWTSPIYNSGRVYQYTMVSQITIIILNIGTDRSEQTVQTQIRLLLMEQSDQGLLCLLFCLHLLNTILHCKIQLFQL